MIPTQAYMESGLVLTAGGTEASVRVHKNRNGALERFSCPVIVFPDGRIERTLYKLTKEPGVERIVAALGDIELVAVNLPREGTTRILTGMNVEVRMNGKRVSRVQSFKIEGAIDRLVTVEFVRNVTSG